MEAKNQARLAFIVDENNVLMSEWAVEQENEFEQWDRFSPLDRKELDFLATGYGISIQLK